MTPAEASRLNRFHAEHVEPVNDAPVPYERPRFTRALIGQALLIFPVVTLIVVGALGITP